MKVTWPKRPFPEVDVARSSSQGIESAAGASACATLAPVTVLPSLAVQLGPAPCLPASPPFASVSVASGRFKVQAYLPSVAAQAYTCAPVAWSLSTSFAPAGTRIGAGTSGAAGLSAARVDAGS